VATLSLERFLLEPWAALPGTALQRPSLFCCLHLNRIYTDELAAELAVAERDAAVGKRKEGVILAHADIGARIIFGAALAHDDVAADDGLATELLDAEAPEQPATSPDSAPQPAEPLKTEGQESVAVDAPNPNAVADKGA
jgi:hypothetical protein